MTDPIRVIEARALDDVAAALAEVESEAAAGNWSAGYVAYEAGPAFDSALIAHEAIAELPLVWFGVFGSRQPVAPPTGAEYELVHWYPNISERTHSESIERIRSYIEAGDTYQVNHTFRLRSEFSGDPMGLYADLVRAQRGDYSAFLDIGTHFIASASPELFFRWSNGRIEVKPMKGTAPRGRWSSEDLTLATALTTSEKDRAENLMIVDLLRNDVGKIAEVGSVNTERLFELERYETVWQLTSTITADLPDSTSLQDVFAALFPCGSITGAPKARTMEIIEELEIDPRGVYCGAIGLVGPGNSGIEAQFSVAIRTVTIEAQTQIAEFGVGGGITWDSTSEGEYQEALWKSAVLDQRRPEFGLTESLRWESNYLFVDEHLKRLADSAEYFGFVYDPVQVGKSLDDLAKELDGPTKVRLRLQPDGTVVAENAGPITEAFADDYESGTEVTVGLATTPIQPHDTTLFHKTTHRAIYEAAANETEASEPLLINAFGELTEGANTNLAVKIDGTWCTPHLESGCLPGVYRQVLIDRGILTERVLKPADLDSCEAIAIINSVRGWRKAALI